MHRVLVVEDEPATLKLMRRILTREGYEVTEASDGEEALEKVMTAPPDQLFDLALLDLHMEGINGWDFLRLKKRAARSRGRGRHVPEARQLRAAARDHQALLARHGATAGAGAFRLRRRTHPVKLWNLEPVTLMAFVGALLTLLVVFSVHLSDPQVEAIKNIIAMGIPIVTAIVARGQVVPINAPDGPQRLMKARLAKGQSANGDSAAARSVYRVAPPAPAAMLADVPRWRHYMPGGLLLSLLAFALFSIVAWTAGCTPADGKIVNGGIVVAGQVCEVVLTAANPALAPLCATAEEVALAIAGLAEEQKAAAKAAGKMGAEFEHPAPPSRDALYQKVLANRAAKKGAVK